MPLLDHFHPPLDGEPPWSSIGTLWVGRLVEWLNRTLPRDEYRTLANVVTNCPEEYEVQIRERRQSMHLAAVVEFVSPANKKEVDERQAFLAKCVSYLRLGVGVVIVDIVTERRMNFHNELMGVMGGPNSILFPPKTPTYVAGYRPVHRDEKNEIEIWSAAAPLGQPIPSVPLAVRGGPVIPLDLDGTYSETLRDHGV